MLSDLPCIHILVAPCKLTVRRRRRNDELWIGKIGFVFLVAGYEDHEKRMIYPSNFNSNEHPSPLHDRQVIPLFEGYKKTTRV
jgi:hypothetical protein